MPQWYCHVGGQNYGPIDDGGLRTWIAEGRVGPGDLLWNPDMPQWAPGGSVPGLFAPGQVPPMGAPSGIVGRAQIAPPYGTGGATSNAQLNARARAMLAGRWGLPIAFSLLLGLLGEVPESVPRVLSGPGYVTGASYVMSWMISLILGGPLALGGTIFYLTFVRRGRAGLEMLFSGFKNFGDALGAHIVVTFLVLLWMAWPVAIGASIGPAIGAAFGAAEGSAAEGAKIGLIAGGIAGLIVGAVLAVLAYLWYSQTFYVLADDPAAGPMEAVRRSKQMMTNRRGKLFCMWLRYYGWGLLCLLTCGIGLLWLYPYMGVGLARFYDDLHPPAEPLQQAQPGAFAAPQA